MSIPPVQTSEASATLLLVPPRLERIPEGRRRAAESISSRPQDRTLAVRGIHPDLIELMPLEKKEKIGIEQIREVIRQAQFTPVQADRKVCLVPHAELLTIEAANALLKVLEEPPRGMVFILMAAHASDLLPTIVSRSRVLRVAPASAVAQTERLRDAGYSDSDARWLIDVACRAGEAEMLAAAPIELEQECRTARTTCESADATELLTACLAGQPILRRFALVELLQRLRRADVLLLTSGVRFLAARSREEVVLLLQELLALCADVLRQPDSAESGASRDERGAVDEAMLVAACHSTEVAHRAISVYGPMEGILFSLFEGLGGGRNGE